MQLDWWSQATNRHSKDKLMNVAAKVKDSVLRMFYGIGLFCALFSVNALFAQNNYDNQQNNANQQNYNGQNGGNENYNQNNNNYNNNYNSNSDGNAAAAAGALGGGSSANLGAGNLGEAAAIEYTDPTEEDVGGYDDPPENLPPVEETPVVEEQPAPQVIEIPRSSFLGSPPMPGNIRDMAEGEAPDSYFVERGDTLFDICDQLLDEGGYWPKLWSFNPQIKNPHFIWPNMRLVFYPGTDETPPFLEVSGEDDLLPIDTGGVATQALITAPLPNITEGPVELKLTEIIGPNEVEPFAEGITVVDYSITLQSRPVTMPGYVFEEELEPDALVLGATDVGAPDTEYRKIIVSIEEEGAIEENQMYTILREAEDFENPHTGEYVGIRYEFIANIKIEKVIEEEEVAYGYLKNHRLVINRGDYLVPYVSSLRTAPASVNSQSGANIETTILGLTHERFNLAADGHFIFLDATQASLSVGQTVNIYQSWESFGGRDAAEYLGDYSRLISQAHVIDVGDLVAVAILYNTISPVTIGDVGEPAILLD